MKKVVAACVHPVILSGGVTTVDDVKKARDAGLAGAVVGSALYFGKLNFEEAKMIDETLTEKEFQKFK